jgi:predicted phage tail protein
VVAPPSPFIHDQGSFLSGRQATAQGTRANCTVRNISEAAGLSLRFESRLERQQVDFGVGASELVNARVLPSGDRAGIRSPDHASAGGLVSRFPAAQGYQHLRCKSSRIIPAA